MSILLPRQPAWLQSKGYSARDDRAVIQALGSGIISGFDLSAGPGMAVTIQPGLAVVPGTTNTGQGSYLQRSDAAIVMPWPAAGAAQRVDTLYMAIIDNTERELAAEGDLPDEGCIIDVAQGVNPVPSDALILGKVTVPASASSIAAANITSVGARSPVSQAWAGSVYNTVDVAIPPDTNPYAYTWDAIDPNSRGGFAPARVAASSWSAGQTIAVPYDGFYHASFGTNIIGGQMEGFHFYLFLGTTVFHGGTANMGGAVIWPTYQGVSGMAFLRRGDLITLMIENMHIGGSNALIRAVDAAPPAQLNHLNVVQVA